MASPTNTYWPGHVLTSQFLVELESGEYIWCYIELGTVSNSAFQKWVLLAASTPSPFIPGHTLTGSGSKQKNQKNRFRDSTYKIIQVHMLDYTIMDYF